mmetsp:Transcript_4402/g.10771  ORF Transcript_4402/g.10771 Transcript_4402/m.10771 type:complete len:820 (-) Transcript_4402:209-2668(-)|eukprot:CAMPEP_0179000236 /NCGR_PEP_ID=MMETSP0795-20121207/10543_1 /TAXON_ID=88552 /ORGANISM="Amoebophrya sp., Strain Ameob2" /LENGTH=819 /DNA_ID=CAMNT_0020693177 /DNA_START=117 /DNA_END=2576 /DNA_ORIENTATION=-
MDGAIASLFHEWADGTASPVSVSFQDLCCLLRWYQVFQQSSAGLTHLDAMALWGKLEEELLDDPDPLDNDGFAQELFIEEAYFTYLLKRLAALVYAVPEEGSDDIGADDWACEQLLNDLAMAAPTFRNPEQERRARDHMRRFFGPIFELDALEEAYERGAALAAIFTHYGTEPNKLDHRRAGSSAFDAVVEEQQFLTTEMLERFCLDVKLLPSALTHDTFLQMVHEYGETSLDFGQFVELLIGLLLSCEDESLSLAEVFEALGIPKNSEYEKNRGVLPFLKKMKTAEEGEDQALAEAALKEMGKMFERLPPAVRGGSWDLHDQVGAAPGGTSTTSDPNSPTGAGGAGNSGAGGEGGGGPGGNNLTVGKMEFTEKELEQMPIQPIPIEEVIAKAHAPKAKGKKGKKKKKKGGEAAFPRPDPGTLVWMRKRAVKPTPKAPPSWDHFPSGIPQPIGFGPSRAKLRNDYVANWLLRPSIIDEPIDVNVLLPADVKKKTSQTTATAPAAQQQPHAAAEEVGGPALLFQKEVGATVALLEAGAQLRREGNFVHSLLAFYKAFRIQQGKVRVQNTAGNEQQAPATFSKPEEHEAGADVGKIMRELVLFVDEQSGDSPSGSPLDHRDFASDAGTSSSQHQHKEQNWPLHAPGDVYLLLELATLGASLYFGALATALVFKLFKRVRARGGSKQMEILVRKQLGVVLFREKEYELAARNFLTVVKMQEQLLGDCNVELAASYNNLATSYMLLAPAPRNREAVAYLTLAVKLMRLFAVVHHPRQPVFLRNLEKAQEAARGPRFLAKPYLYYISLAGKEKKGKKKGKKKKK